MASMWKVGTGYAEFFEEFRKAGQVAIGYGAPLDLAPFRTREAIERAILDSGRTPKGKALTYLTRIAIEVQPDDWMVCYGRQERQYIIGRVVGSYKFDGTAEDRMHVRSVQWMGTIERDDVSEAARKLLDERSAIFEVDEPARGEMLALLEGKPVPVAPAISTPQSSDDDEPEDEDRRSLEEQAQDLISDMVSRLGPYEMQDLVAGILRAMNYKTRVSPPGADGGKDIVASPDGLGLQDPRVLVQVKHRKGQTSAPDIRNFLGVLRGGGARGLFVSTGGFTKDARMEAERSDSPVTLLDLGELVELLIEHYDKVDQRTTALVPLTPIYWPSTGRG